MLNMDQMRHVAKIVHGDHFDVPDCESTVCSDEDYMLGEEITAEWYDEEDDEVFLATYTQTEFTLEKRRKLSQKR